MNDKSYKGTISKLPIYLGITIIETNDSPPMYSAAVYDLKKPFPLAVADLYESKREAIITVIEEFFDKGLLD